MNQNAQNTATLAVVGRVLSRSAGVALRIEGDTAKTDGKTITIPDLGERLDEKRLELALGYLYHEAGHCRYTDFELIARPGIPLETRKLFGILEDIAVEAHMGREYAGCLETLTALNERVLEAWPHPLPSLLLNCLRDVAGQRKLTKAPDQQLAKAAFGKDVFERVAAACAPGRTSADRLALARSLVAALDERMVREMAEAERRDRANEKGGLGRAVSALRSLFRARSDKDGEKGKTGATPSPRVPSARNLLRALREYESQGERLAGMLTAEHEKASREAREAGEENAAKKRADDAGEAAGRLAASLEALRGEAGATGTAGRVHVLPAPEADDAAEYFRLRDRHARLGDRFIRLFRSEHDEAWVEGLDQGSIDGRALCKIKTGQFRVFKQRRRTPRIAHETAVSLLVDCSGSMSGGRLENAMAAVALFLESLARADVACEVLGFTTAIIRAWDGSLTGGEPLAYEFKRFAEPLAPAARRRVAGYGKLDLGGTNIVDPLLLAYDHLMRRPEPRRILFVLTDGHEGGRGEEELARVARAIEAEGLVEPIAIDLMSGRTEGLFTRRVVVDSARDLPKQMMAGLERRLLAPRRAARKRADRE